MKAKTVNENINFERGKDPKKSLGIGAIELENIYDTEDFHRWKDTEEIIYIINQINRIGYAYPVYKVWVDKIYLKNLEFTSISGDRYDINDLLGKNVKFNDGTIIRINDKMKVLKDFNESLNFNRGGSPKESLEVGAKGFDRAILIAKKLIESEKAAWDDFTEWEEEYYTEQEADQELDIVKFSCVSKKCLDRDGDGPYIKIWMNKKQGIDYRPKKLRKDNLIVYYLPKSLKENFGTSTYITSFIETFGYVMNESLNFERGGSIKKTMEIGGAEIYPVIHTDSDEYGYKHTLAISLGKHPRFGTDVFLGLGLMTINPKTGKLGPIEKGTQMKDLSRFDSSAIYSDNPEYYRDLTEAEMKFLKRFEKRYPERITRMENYLYDHMNKIHHIKKRYKIIF